MTKRKSELAEKHFARVRSNPLARMVKAANPADNTAPGRVAKLDAAHAGAPSWGITTGTERPAILLMLARAVEQHQQCDATQQHQGGADAQPTGDRDSCGRQAVAASVPDCVAVGDLAPTGETPSDTEYVKRSVHEMHLSGSYC